MAGSMRITTRRTGVRISIGEGGLDCLSGCADQLSSTAWERPFGFGRTDCPCLLIFFSKTSPKPQGGPAAAIAPEQTWLAGERSTPPRRPGDCRGSHGNLAAAGRSLRRSRCHGVVCGEHRPRTAEPRRSVARHRTAGGSWMDRGVDEKRFVFSAAAHAQSAVDPWRTNAQLEPRTADARNRRHLLNAYLRSPALGQTETPITGIISPRKRALYVAYLPWAWAATMIHPVHPHLVGRRHHHQAAGRTRSRFSAIALETG